MTLHPDIERVALLGWHVYPCSRRSKAGCFKGASAAATCDLDVLAMWQDEYNPNWRVVCGPSKIWGIDIDAPSDTHKADGVSAFKRLASCYPPLPARPTTKSGGGGFAMFFRFNGEEICGRTAYPEPGIDPRRGALSVTIPPSIHIDTGRSYRWLIPPWQTSPPDAPDWLLRLMRPPADIPIVRRDVVDDTHGRRVLIKAITDIRGAASGAGNDTLNRKSYTVARWVAAGALHEAEAIEALYCAAMDRNIPRPEARATIKSAFRKGMARPMERAA